MTPDDVLWALISAWRDQAARLAMEATSAHAPAGTSVRSELLHTCADMLAEAISAGKAAS